MLTCNAQYVTLKTLLHVIIPSICPHESQTQHKDCSLLQRAAQSHQRLWCCPQGGALAPQSFAPWRWFAAAARTDGGAAGTKAAPTDTHACLSISPLDSTAARNRDFPQKTCSKKISGLNPDHTDLFPLTMCEFGFRAPSSGLSGRWGAVWTGPQALPVSQLVSH